MTKLFHIFLLIIASTLPINASVRADMGVIYNKFKNMPVSELKEKGEGYYKVNQLDSALMCYSLIADRLENSSKSIDSHLLAEAEITCGHIYFLLSDFPKAYKCFLMALDVNDPQLTPRAYVYLAVLHTLFKENLTASDYFEKAYHLSKKNKDWNTLMSAYLNLLSISSNLKDPAKYKNLIEEFTTLPIPDDSLRNYCIYYSKSWLKMLDGKYDEALKFAYLAKDAAGSRNNYRYTFSSYQWIGKLFELEGKTDSVINNLLECEKLAMIIGTPELMEETYKSLAQSYTEKGQFNKAAEYKQRHLELRDSIFGLNTISNFKDIQKLYEMEKVEREMIEVRHERDIANLWIIIICIGLAAAIGITSFVIYHNMKLKTANRKLFERIQESLASNQTLDAISDLAPVDTTEETEREITEDEDKNVDLKLRNSIIEYIENSPEVFSTDFDMSAMAEALGSNTTYVSKAINSGMGFNFRTLLNQRRIKEACRRLSDFETCENLATETIGEQIGFKSYSSFRSVFKKITGLSPSEYRKLAKEQQG